MNKNEHLNEKRLHPRIPILEKRVCIVQIAANRRFEGYEAGVVHNLSQCGLLIEVVEESRMHPPFEILYFRLFGQSFKTLSGMIKIMNIRHHPDLVSHKLYGVTVAFFEPHHFKEYLNLMSLCEN